MGLHGDSEEGVHKGDSNNDTWSCKKLGQRNTFEDEDAIMCARPGDDCRMATCCTRGACYIKNEEYGSCHLSCPAGWNLTVVLSSSAFLKISRRDAVLRCWCAKGRIVAEP